jgi:hypothetical protein
MKIGQKYNCKILLFGGLPSPKDLSNIKPLKLIVAEHNVLIGRLKCLKTVFDNNFYYVAEDDIEELYNPDAVDEFEFVVTRKDIIQVDDIIHPYFLS